MYRPLRSIASTGLLALAFAGGCDASAVPEDVDRGTGPTASPRPGTSTEPGARVFFRDSTQAWGIDFESAQRFTGEFPIFEIMGHGLAVFDADGDGVLDLYFANAGPRADDAAPDALYRGLPQGGFVDMTAASGLGHTGWSTGVAAGDIDNDGDLDLYVGAWGADRLYRNDGGGRFTDVTESAGIVDSAMTSSIAFLDHDGDGFLDIFVVHYVIPDPDRECGGIGGGREFCAPAAYTPSVDTLYRNRGDGTFEDVSATAGIAERAASGLGVAVADLTGDGRVDLFIANDQMPNHLWENLGDGTFREAALLLGAALSGRGNAEASMGVDIADVNGDGALDVFVTHIAGETNTLYLSDGASAFRDASVASGVGAPSHPYTAFGTAFADIDLDGTLDLLIGNGRVSRAARIEGARSPGEFALYAEPNLILVNDGAGRFTDVSSPADAFCGPVEVTRGLAIGDFDRDGDVDVVVSNVAGPVRALENISPRSGHWLAVTARDPELLRDTPGALVVVRAGDRSRARPAGGGWSYMSRSAGAVHFGLGAAEVYDAIEVTWPGGSREVFPGGPADRLVVVERGRGTPR